VKLTAAIVLVLSLAPVPNGRAQSLEEIRKVEALQNFSDKLDELSVAFEAHSRARRTQCLKAFGDPRFCACISDKLAVAWSFADYVAITTRTKEENGYEILESDLKVAYDRVGPVRDECVASLVAP
jgi:hypothetical protein